ncbi:cupin domain-containing protein [Bacteroidota bacterium]
MNSSIFLLQDELLEEYVQEGISRIVMGYDRDLMMVKVKFKPGVSVEPHHHVHSQSSLISKGSFKVTIGGDTKLLKEGEGFFVPPNVVHSVISIEESEIIDAFNPVRKDFLREQ